MKKTPKFESGKQARKNFEDGMRKLFRVPKSEVVESQTKTPKGAKQK